MERLLLLVAAFAAADPSLPAQSVAWVEAVGTNSPSERFSSGVAFDWRTGVTVLFGGANNFGEKFGDTWIWRNGWLQIHPAATSPPGRQGPGMIWDEDARNIVMFGGIDQNGAALNDTWIWDGNDWIQQFPPVSPPGRLLDGEGMTYDPATHSAVLFGGASPNGGLNDTWTWNGFTKTWRQHFPASSPAPRRTVIAYDYAAGNVVLFGGDDGNVHYGDTWTWDGVNWKLRFPARSPSPRTMAPSLGTLRLGWSCSLGELAGRR